MSIIPDQDMGSSWKSSPIIQDLTFPEHLSMFFSRNNSMSFVAKDPK
ncbi:hypothetical protein GW765_00750 [Candidatus Parcubacteria bacterium]|nr:hypothetical protein [Candidatus Parcubacteria bacterium]